MVVAMVVEGKSVLEGRFCFLYPRPTQKPPFPVLGDGQHLSRYRRFGSTSAREGTEDSQGNKGICLGDGGWGMRWARRRVQRRIGKARLRVPLTA